MYENEEDLEFDSPLEEEIEEAEVQQGRNRIFTDQGDPEIESLHNKWQRGKLFVQPELVDDAALDHIEQYWRGGKTVPENARLAHRYCNWARPRKG